MKFQFEQAVKDLGVKGTYFVIDGLRNKKTDIGFAEFSKIDCQVKCNKIKGKIF